MIVSHITIVHYQNQEIDIYVIHRAYSEGRENIRIQRIYKSIRGYLYTGTSYNSMLYEKNFMTIIIVTTC